MTDKDRLTNLINDSTPAEELEDWIKGKIPKHYKRNTIPESERMELAVQGQSKVGAYFNDSLYYTQSLIAGAVFSGKYNTILIVTPSQYGKSWLFSRIGIILAYERKGEDTYITAATKELTKIIMRNVHRAMKLVAEPVQNSATGGDRSKLDRLEQSLSKENISFPGRGSLSTKSTGDTYNDKSKDGLVGVGGIYLMDEASFISDDAFAETGRSELHKKDGTVSPLVAISNPHNTGWFWDGITDENPPEDTAIIWMDARTAYEEGVWKKEKILSGRFTGNLRTIREYWLCELNESGDSMFNIPKTYKAPYIGDYTQYFIGIDSAYKGKDNINVCVLAVGDDNLFYVEEIRAIKKDSKWIEGKTEKEIVKTLARICNAYRCTKVCVDIGYGIWIITGLIDLGQPVQGINFAQKPTRERISEGIKPYAVMNAANVRAEMHLDLQMLIDDDKIRVSEEVLPQIKNVLPLITSKRASSGKLQIRPKPEIKAALGKSPDEFDSLLLAVHAAILSISEDI